MSLESLGGVAAVCGICYIAAIWLVSIIITCVDKSCAKKGKWRVSEGSLLFFAAVGGAVPMLVTMKAIRHKTLHKKFMIGLPVIICLHTAILIFLIMWLTNRI